MPSFTTTSQPSTLPFSPDQACLERIIAKLTADGHVAGAFVGAEQRRLAFAEYTRAARPMLMPASALRWACGEINVATRPLDHDRRLPESPEQSGPALAVDNAGGVMHAGGISLATPHPPNSLAGVVICSLTQAHTQHAALFTQAQSALQPPAQRCTTALAQAFQNCGAFIYVGDGIELSAPIQLIWTYSVAAAQAIFPRVLVFLGKGSRAHIIERHLGEGDGFVCGSVDLNLQENACLDYSVVQHTSENVYSSMTRSAVCAASAKLIWSLAELGGGAVHSVVNTTLEGTCAQVTLALVGLRTAMQTLDSSHRFDHLASETRSTGVVHVALGERAQARLTRVARVSRRAAAVTLTLSDDALLLSKRARISLRPKVVNRHHSLSSQERAKVGSIEKETLFYILSRGIGLQEARRMIMLAFFEPAIQQFPGELFKDEIRTLLDEHIDNLTFSSSNTMC